MNIKEEIAELEDACFFVAFPGSDKEHRLDQTPTFKILITLVSQRWSCLSSEISERSGVVRGAGEAVYQATLKVLINFIGEANRR